MNKRHVFTSLTIALAGTTLSSCGLVQSAAKVPGSLLKSVGRTVGMPVNHTEQAAPEKPDIEIVGDGVIEQLD